MRVLLRWLFNLLAGVSLVVFLVGMVGMGFIIYFRCTHLTRTGRFSIDGPPDAVASYLKAERATVQLTLAAVLLPLIWFSDRLRSDRANRPSSSHNCPRCGYEIRYRMERCPKCGAEAW